MFSIAFIMICVGFVVAFNFKVSLFFRIGEGNTVKLPTRGHCESNYT